MRLTTKGRFAVTAMLDLAMGDGKSPVTLAGISRRQKSVGEREERLTGDHGTTEVEPRLARLPDRDAGTVDPRHLAGTDPERLFAAAVDDGVRLHVLAHAPAEHHRRPFLGGRLTLCDDAERRNVAQGAVAVLQQHSAHHRTDFQQRIGADPALRHHEAQVLFLPEDREGLVAEARGDDHFREDFSDGGGEIRAERLVDDDDPAEGRLPVGRVGLLPGGDQGVGRDARGRRAMTLPCPAPW